MATTAESATASSARLPKEKQTVLGLYVTAKEAYAFSCGPGPPVRPNRPGDAEGREGPRGPWGDPRPPSCG
jgi:hypothetical protein